MYEPLDDPRSLRIHSPPRGNSSACRRETVLSVSGNCRLSRPISAGASGSSNRRPLSGPCMTRRVSTERIIRCGVRRDRKMFALTCSLLRAGRGAAKTRRANTATAKNKEQGASNNARPSLAGELQLFLFHDHIVVAQQRALGELEAHHRDVVVGDGFVLQAIGVGQVGLA